MADQNSGSGQQEPTKGSESITKADYDNQVARAQRFEGMVRDLELKMDRFKNIDPDKYSALQEEVNILKRDAAVGDPKKFDEELSRQVGEVRSTVERETNELREQLKTLSTENKELKVTNKVFALASSQLIDGAQDDCKEYIRRYCDLSESGEIIVKDENGKPKYKKGSVTQLMGPEDFISWLQEIRGHWFQPKGKPGLHANGHMAPSNGAHGSVGLDRYLQMSASERAQLPIADQRKLATEALRGKRFN